MENGMDPALLRLNGYEAPVVSTDIRPIQEPKQGQEDLIRGRLNPAKGYGGRIQPPDPDPVREDSPSGLLLPNGQAAPPPPSPVPSFDKRLCLSFGPQAGTLMLTLEHGPDWEVGEGEAWLLPGAVLRQIMPILRQIIRVKDQTGGLWQGPQLVAEESEP